MTVMTSDQVEIATFLGKIVDVLEPNKGLERIVQSRLPLEEKKKYLNTFLGGLVGFDVGCERLAKEYKIPELKEIAPALRSLQKLVTQVRDARGDSGAEATKIVPKIKEVLGKVDVILQKFR